MPTVIETRTGRWRTVAWDEEAQAWRTIDAGDVVFESEGDFPDAPGAYLPQSREGARLSRGAT